MLFSVLAIWNIWIWSSFYLTNEIGGGGRGGCMKPLAAGCEAYYLYLNRKDSLLDEGPGLSGGVWKVRLQQRLAADKNIESGEQEIFF